MGLSRGSDTSGTKISQNLSRDPKSENLNCNRNLRRFSGPDTIILFPDTVCGLIYKTHQVCEL